LEEDHYYPFGLLMSGISDKAIKTQYAENKYQFNNGTELQSKEFSDGSGLEMYNTDFRGYDPQLGRFWQIDPYAEGTENISPYAFGVDNPISYNDPLGLDTSWKVLPTAVVVYTPNTAPRSEVTTGLADTKGDVGEIAGTGLPNSSGTENGSSTSTAGGGALTIGAGAVEGGAETLPWAEVLAPVVDVLPPVLITGALISGMGIHPNVPTPTYHPAGDITIGIPVPHVTFAKDKTDHLRGGKQKRRDASIKRYPKEFQRWYHREYKQPGDPDATADELKELFEEWKLEHPDQFEEPKKSPIDSIPGAIPQ